MFISASNWSNETLVSKPFVRNTTFEGLGHFARVSWAGEKQVVASDRPYLQIALQDSEKQMEPTDAHSLADPPMRTSMSVDAILSQCPHLREVIVIRWESEGTGLPLTCKIPGGKIDLLIRASIISTSMLIAQGTGVDGPGLLKRTALVAYITTERELNRLYDQELRDLGDDRPDASREDLVESEILRMETLFLPGHLEVPLPWRQQAGRTLSKSRYRFPRPIHLREGFHRDSRLGEGKS